MELQNATFYVLPGTVAKQGSANYYAINRADTVKLLQEKFNPYGIEMKEEHLQINEIATAKGETDTQEQTMQQIAVEQSAATTTTTAATTAAQ